MNSMEETVVQTDCSAAECYWRFSSEELLLPSDEPVSECELSKCSQLPVARIGVKRTRSSSISTSILLPSVIYEEEKNQLGPSFLTTGNFVNVCVSEGKEQEVPKNEVLWADGREQQSIRARPAFLPTFSFSSFPTSFMGSIDKPSSSSSDTSESFWNQMFDDLLSPAVTISPAEPEAAESPETRNISVSLPTRNNIVPQENTNSFPPPTGNKTDPLLTKTKNGALPSLPKEEKPKSRKPRNNDIHTNKEYIENPTENDVILGRGGRSNHHNGNKIYRQLVEDTKMLYKTCGKDEKTKISQLLVDRIQSEHHGRFVCLDKAEKKWYVVSDSVARKKVSQALREINTPESRAAKRQKYSRREETASL